METKTEKVYRIHLDDPKYRLGDIRSGGANIIALLKDFFDSMVDQHDFIDWPSLSIEKDKYRPYVLIVKVLCYDFNGEMNNAQ